MELLNVALPFYVYSFLDKLETLTVEVQSKRRKFILCGDCNINFLWDSVQLQALHIVLLSYNLTNVVTLPTRVTKNTSSLIDVMIINKQYNNNSTEVVCFGHSDYFAWILCSLVNKQNNRIGKITGRKFSRRNIENLKYLLENESWAEIHMINNLNDLYKLFLSKFIFYLESAFPIKT